MQKIVFMTLFAYGLMVSSVSANTLKEQHIGYVNMDLGDSTGNGITMGYNILYPVFIETVDGVYFGFNTNLNFLKFDSSEDDTETSEDSSFSFGFNGSGLIGYEYKNILMKLGIGFDYTAIGLNSGPSFFGVLYTTSVEYRFTDTFATEVAYKTGQMHLYSGNDNSSVNKSQFELNFVWKF